MKAKEPHVRASAGDAAKPSGDPTAVGARLRAEREQRGLSVRALARRLEVSPSLVSQIETGKARPSVKTLYAIVSELGVSLDELFMPNGVGSATVRRSAPPQVERTIPDFVEGAAQEPGGPVQRAETRRSLELESGVRWERLTADHDPDIDFLYAVYAVGGSSSPGGKLVRHSGREFGLVLSGRLGVTVAFEEYALGPGDSISFESTTPHRLHNDGAEEAHAIWVVYGRRS